jgi:cephalosporin hydroxylase
MPYYDHYYILVDAVPDPSSTELNTIRDFLRQHSFERYIEVGIGRLGTLCRMARFILANNLPTRCIGIDAFGELPKDVLGNNTHQGDVIRLEDAEDFLASEGLDKLVTLYKGDSSRVLGEILPALKNARKLFFIDANHSFEGCRADFEIIDKYVVPGDVLIFDDTLEMQHIDYGRGPRGVVEDYLVPNPRFRKIIMPPPNVTLEDNADALSIFECVG